MEAKMTNYDIRFGSIENAARQVTVEIQKAMIAAIPVSIANPKADECEIEEMIDVTTRWQGRLMASTYGAIEEWALDFLSVGPNESPK